MKLCKNCGSSERYLSGNCKPCSKKASSKFRAKNLEQQKLYDYKLRTTNPKEYRKKRNEQVARRRDANPEEFRKKDRDLYLKYHAESPERYRLRSQNRRAKKRENGGELSKGIIDKLYNLQLGKCPCCNLPLGDDYHMDHIMPVFLGGSNEDWNIQLLRSTCNLQKHTKHPIDFMQSKGFLL